MGKSLIKTERVMQPVGPYSLGVKVKNGALIFLSGVSGHDKSGKIKVGDFGAQCRQAYENLKVLLEAAGATMNDIVKFTNYLVNADDYPIMAEIRKEYIKEKESYPASTLIEVKGLLYKEMLVEIEAIAVLAG